MAVDVHYLGEAFSARLRREVQDRLRKAGMNTTAEEYLGWILLLSSLVFILLLPFNPLLAVVTGSLLFSTGLYAPLYLAQLRSARADSELPFFLKSLSTMLRSGIDPLEALTLASKGRPTLEASVSSITKLRKSGISLKRAFEREAETYLSPRVKKTLLMVSSIIESGHGLEALDRFSDSLLQAKRIETKEFSSKLALYTLVFIALTALVPSILLAYSVLFPMVFGEQMDPAVLTFTLFFAVPLLTAATLLYLWRRSA